MTKPGAHPRVDIWTLREVVYAFEREWKHRRMDPFRLREVVEIASRLLMLCSEQPAPTLMPNERHVLEETIKKIHEFLSKFDVEEAILE